MLSLICLSLLSSSSRFLSPACCSLINDCSALLVKFIDLPNSIRSFILTPVLPVVALGIFFKTFFNAIVYPLVITLLFQHFLQLSRLDYLPSFYRKKISFNVKKTGTVANAAASPNTTSLYTRMLLLLTNSSKNTEKKQKC